MFDPPLNMILSARRNSGKTTLLLRMLMSKDIFKNKFDQVILICPTYSFQQIYHDFAFSQVYQEFSIGLIEKLIDYFKETPDVARLLIFDDCISADDFKSSNVAQALNELVVIGRHYGVSTIFLTQRYNAVAPVIRTNLEYLIFFNTRNHVERTCIYEEYGFLPRADFMDWWDATFTDRYDTILLDIANDRVYKNFKLLHFSQEKENDSE
jgi:hypothetical protein